MNSPTAAMAANRFGLSEASLARVGDSPQDWLLRQIGPGDAPWGASLATGTEAIRHHAEYLRAQRTRRAAASASVPVGAAGMADDAGRSTEQAFVDHFRAQVDADQRSRGVTAAISTRPFAERMVWFWSNHFTVSMAKASARGLVGSFEREAIRPHIAGRFATMLKASTRHPAMLSYLDNVQSAGPHSRIVNRLARRAEQGGDAARVTGLNENLAREVLELHTLGAQAARDGRYTQADVSAFAALLTGWRVPLPQVLSGEIGPAESATRFDPAWHEPGNKTVLGRRYAEGEAALDTLLDDLAREPACARFVCTKLARHVIADDPPPTLVDGLVKAWTGSDGDLAAVYRALIRDPLAWRAAPAKLKTPEEWVVSTARILQLGAKAYERTPDGGVGALGQRVQAAPSPAGWPDRAEEWLGPDAVWKRVEWATRVADRVRTADARTIARESLGPLLTDATRAQIERAMDGPQALALLLLSPEFQRR